MAPGVTAGEASTSCGAPNVAPPSCEMFTQIWLGPKKSWYMSTTSALAVVPPAGIEAATQSRSTPNAEQLVAHCGIKPAPCVHVCPWSTDFQTSACSGATPGLPARLHRYTELAWSVARQSSPLFGSA